MTGFSVGAIVSKLELNKKGWDASVKSVEKDQKTMTAFAKKHGEAMKKMGRGMTIAGAAILAGVGVAVKAFAGFDKSMTESLAIMGDISEALREEMADAAKQMSTESTFAAKELAEAYFFLASAGLDAKASIAALPAVTKFAQAGAFNLAQATDLLTDAQSALGLTIRDDVIKNQKNMIAVSDLLVGANTLANASVRQFAESLTNRAAAALRAVNKPMEEGVAVLAAFADQGRKGSEAGMALDIVLRDLQKAARDNEEEFAKVGVTVFDSTGKLANMGDIIGDLEVLLDGMSDKQKGATLSMLGFQERSISNIKTLLGTSSAIKEYQAKLEDMAGITDRVSEKQLEAFSAKMILVKNKITIAAIEIGEKLAPTIEKMADIIGKAAKKISEWIEKHPKLTSVILKVVAGLGALMAILGPILMILPGIIAAVGAMSASFLAAIAPIAATVAIFGFTITKIIKLIKVLGQLKRARKAAREAEERNIKVIGDFEKKLRGLTTAAGVTKEEFDKLLKKYNGNVVALASAIKRGKELVDVQGIMAESTKEITGEVEKGTEAIEDQEEAVDNLLEKEKDWTDFLKSIGIKTIEEKAKRTEFLEGVLNDLEIQLEDNVITLEAYRIAVKKATDEINGFSRTVVNTAVPAARDMSKAIDFAVGEMKGDMQDFSDEVEDVYVEVKNYTDQLVNDLGTSFGNFVGSVLTKGTSLKDGLKNLWGDIKASFVNMMADMARDFAINFVKNIIMKSLTVNTAMAKTSAVFTTMGKTVAGIGEGMGKLISSLAKGIGKAIEALAKSIAVAARTLAAAAPQLLIVGGVALALMAGFKAIQSLFTKGKRKAAAKGNELLQDIRNKLYEIWNESQWMVKAFLGEQQGRLDNLIIKADWTLAATEGILGYVTAIKDYTQEIASNTHIMAKALINLPKAQHGGYFPEPALVNVGEVPEIVAPVQTIQKIIEGGGGRISGGKEINITIQNEISPTFATLDPMTMRDVWRDSIEPEMLDSLSTKGKILTAMKEALGVK